MQRNSKPAHLGHDAHEMHANHGWPPTNASFAATLGLFEVDVWWELSTLISVMLLGHWLEVKATTQAQNALNALATLREPSVS